ncbi:MAG: ArsR family transcriptional regulator [Bacteroidia bacterium]
MKFFLNSNARGYLRNLESEFGESTNAIRLELNKFEKAGLLATEHQGNKKFFRANTTHPLFQDIHRIILKYVGLDQIVENVVKRLGNVEQVYLVGAFSKGLDSSIIDLIFVGQIDTVYLVTLIGKAEKLIDRKIRFITYTSLTEAGLDQYDPEPLLLWART